jgi:hypothetical protein
MGFIRKSAFLMTGVPVGPRSVKEKQLAELRKQTRYMQQLAQPVPPPAPPRPATPPPSRSVKGDDAYVGWVLVLVAVGVFVSIYLLSLLR